jgi:hypothetical protein
MPRARLGQRPAYLCLIESYLSAQPSCDILQYLRSFGQGGNAVRDVWQASHDDAAGQDSSYNIPPLREQL